MRGAIIISFCLTLITLPLVSKATNRAYAPIKVELEEHKGKLGIPSTGSVSMIISFSAFIFIGFRNTYGYIALLGAFLFFLLGFADDFLKVRRHCSDGLKSLTKLFFQLLISALIAYLIRNYLGYYKELNPVLYYIGSILIIAYYANAANITDGLDSLLTKVSLPVLLLYATLLSNLRGIYLSYIFILLAFLWYNSAPASIFMGDGGSHLTGFLLAYGALLSTRPLLFLIAGLVFFIELISSFIQIFSIRVFHRKVFLIAPIHHAMQKRGMSEAKISDRFFVLSAAFSFFAYLILKGGVIY